MRKVRKAPVERALSLRFATLNLAAGALLAAWAVPAYAAAPQAVDDAYSTLRGVALVTTASNGVLANDSDPDKDPITAQLARAPTHGSLQLNSDGSFRYRRPATLPARTTFNTARATPRATAIPRR